MIKLKDILMESYISIYYWMDPNGKFHKVDNEEHAPWAAEYITSNNLPVLVKGSWYKTMYKMGWVRVGLVGYSGKLYLAYNYDSDIGLTQNAFRHLKNFAIERSVDFMRDDTKGKVIDLLERIEERLSYNDLLGASEKGRVQRASDVRARSIPVSTENGLESWNFRYKSNPSVTGEPHQGQIRFLKESVKSSDNAEDLDCIVDCSCPDFRYRWAYANMKQDAGVIGNKSLNKCINRAPVKMNPNEKPGLCKHLIALRNYLKTKINTSSKQNIFESLDNITKTPTFNVEM